MLCIRAYQNGWVKMYAPLSNLDLIELQKLLDKGIEIREAVQRLEEQSNNENKSYQKN